MYLGEFEIRIDLDADALQLALPFKLADFWNTVVWQYKFRTSTLCRAVRRGCQALALDDERAEFEPVLWDEGDAYTKSRVTQVWFAGAHSNVGGGYPQQGMSLVALDWMMKHAEQEDLRFVPHLRDQYSGEQSFADKLYDPRSGSGMFYRWRPRDVAALCAERGTEIAHWLLLITNTTGNFHTPAMLMAS